tara:strand:- start:21 stop:611 length:591 start_codon:yes stop_codon:yes gene_type:complete
MPSFIKQGWLATGLVVAVTTLSGCALSPQIINLQTQSPLIVDTEVLGRSALVRVRDLREETDKLGYRGGTTPLEAPLLTKPSLQLALTEKMQNSLQQLGFGGASPFDPVKVDLAVEEFIYQCNEGAWVSQCDLKIQLTMTIDNEERTFSQPFKIKQQRSVATAPRAGYNEEWINQALNKLWSHMLTQPQVIQALGM